MGSKTIIICDWCERTDAGVRRVYQTSWPEGWKEVGDDILCAECFTERRRALKEAMHRCATRQQRRTGEKGMSIELQEALKKARSKILWCVHVLGPDELIPQPSHWDAEQYASKLVVALHRSGALGDDVLVLPVVEPWPLGHDAYWEAMKREAVVPAGAGEKKTR